MNRPNNKRKRVSQEKIEKVFLEFIQVKNIEDISVTDICKVTGLNRSTFYANYIDIYDLVDRIKDKMVKNFFNVYKEETLKKEHSYDFLKLFQHIKDNQLFYKTYFKLNLDLSSYVQFLDEAEAQRFDRSFEDVDYHVAFFKAGLNAILKKWLDDGCDKSPEEIQNIIKREYKYIKIED